MFVSLSGDKLNISIEFTFLPVPKDIPIAPSILSLSDLLPVFALPFAQLNCAFLKPITLAEALYPSANLPLVVDAQAVSFLISVGFKSLRCS